MTLARCLCDEAIRSAQPLTLARAASLADRRSVEAFAGVWEASDATWELVMLLLGEEQ